MLWRDRLLKRLDARWDMRVVVMTAAAGYGKTTLLHQAIEASAERKPSKGIDCLVTCEPQHEAASALAESICQALGSALSLQAGVMIEQLAKAVRDAVLPNGRRQVALLIDDVHQIPARSEGALLLARIVETLPSNGHLVFSGRIPPPVELAKLDLAGEVEWIDENELKFDEDELCEFVALKRVGPEQVADCEGWPALVELSVRARTGGTEEFIVQVALSHLEPDHRKALALLGQLGSFDVELACEVLGSKLDVTRIFAGVPLVTRVADGEWYIHPLWKSWLGDMVTPAEVAEVLREGGMWLYRRGRVVEAVWRLIDAEAWDELTQALAVALGAAHPPVARDVLGLWLSRLPDHVRDDDCGQLLAAVLAVESDPDGAWDKLEACWASFRERGQTSGELACMVQLGQLAWWSEQPERLHGVAARAFELDAEEVREAKPLACLGRALLADLVGDNETMLRELESIPHHSLNDAWQGIVSWAKAIALLQSGLASDAQAEAERALEHVESLHAPLAEITKLQAMWQQGQTNDVAEELPRLVRRVAASGYRSQTVLGFAHASLVHAMLGQIEQANMYWDRARLAATGVPNRPLVDTALAFARAAILVAAGDDGAAQDELGLYVEQYPANSGLPAAAQRRNLVLLYTLVPATRPIWDDADLGPAFRTSRDLACAITTVREQGELPRSTPPLPGVGVIQAGVPIPWVADLAVAAKAAGRDEGLKLLEATWMATHRRVQHLAENGTRSTAIAAREALRTLPKPPTSRWRLRLLGPIELLQDGVPTNAKEWNRGRVRELLAYLALHGTVSWERAGNDLWPQHSSDDQDGNLKFTRSCLLDVLEPDRSKNGPSFFVPRRAGNLYLNSGEWLVVDTEQFEALCRESERADSPEDVIECALAAAALWRGRPCTELVDKPWARDEFEQRQLGPRFAKIAAKAGEMCRGLYRFDEALTLGEAGLAADELDTCLHCLVVRVHRGLGNDLAAQRTLLRYIRVATKAGIPVDPNLTVEEFLSGCP